MEKGKIIIFSAPSGSGKTTLVKWLLGQNLNLYFSISATSRQPRSTETNGKDYYFLSPEAFRQKIAEDAFLEWEEVYPDKFYGTLKSEVERIISEGKHVLFDVDVKGGLNIKKHFGAQALSIFVQPPGIEVLRQRLEFRGTDSAEIIQERVEKAAYELTFAPQFDLVVINDKLDQAKQDCLKKVKDFLEK
ncbi:MAG: guanylate kinase [Bacteroidales bacterium]|nr:guanylate kinase [Bacteroidales bacterium]MDD4712698.1 guanylate kinase [Bacteroidales bacterium]